MAPLPQQGHGLTVTVTKEDVEFALQLIASFRKQHPESTLKNSEIANPIDIAIQRTYPSVTKVEFTTTAINSRLLSAKTEDELFDMYLEDIGFHDRDDDSELTDAECQHYNVGLGHTEQGALVAVQGACRVAATQEDVGRGVKGTAQRLVP